MGQVTVFSRLERRRRWSEEERLQILSEAFAPGACVADVCRRHDISSALIYTWRRKLLDAGAAQEADVPSALPAPVFAETPQRNVSSNPATADRNGYGLHRMDTTRHPVPPTRRAICMKLTYLVISIDLLEHLGNTYGRRDGSTVAPVNVAAPTTSKRPVLGRCCTSLQGACYARCNLHDRRQPHEAASRHG